MSHILGILGLYFINFDPAEYVLIVLGAIFVVSFIMNGIRGD